MRSRLSIATATPFIVLFIIVAAAVAYSLVRRNAVGAEQTPGSLPYYKTVAADSLPFREISFEEDSQASSGTKRASRKKARHTRQRVRKAASDAAAPATYRDFLSDTIPSSK